VVLHRSAFSSSAVFRFRSPFLFRLVTSCCFMDVCYCLSCCLMHMD
jgi:hypothetical protein